MVGMLLGFQALPTSITRLSSSVYEMPVATVEVHRVWVVVASAEITNTPDLFEWVRQTFVNWDRLCYDLRGRNFEHNPVPNPFNCISNVEL
ncbi:hypothetical protein TNCV_4977721 [Trichonephila clavipes]|nr:hypothetical protein TNCV_4977721 [Trichonephila clavipes]